MEKKIAILMIIILLIGLFGGFILSYVVHQPQIQALTNEVASLEEENEDLETENDELLSKLLEALSKLSPNNNSNSTEPEPDNGTEPTPELLEIQDAQITTNGTHFEIDFTIRNSGTVNTSIIMMALNQDPIQILTDVTALVFNGTAVSAVDTFIFPIPVGAFAQFIMTLKKGVVDGLNLQSGDTLVLMLTSDQLNEYPMTFELP